MPQLIDLTDAPPPPVIRLAVGDVVMLASIGARLEPGDALELLGIYTQAFATPAGETIAPQGPPSRVLVRGRTPGSGDLTLLGGQPFGPSTERRITLVVEGAAQA